MRILINFINKVSIALIANRNFIYIKPTQLILKFVKLLFLEGFISKVVFFKEKNLLKIYLKYSFMGYPIIRYLTRFSKVSLSYSINYSQLSKLSKVGIFFLSTPYGFLSNSACLKLKIGGKLLVYFN